MSFWQAIATIAPAAIGGILGSDDDDSENKKTTESNSSTTNQYSAEQQEAQKLLLSYIKGNNADNLYGATDIDWADLWDKTQQKINQSYYGSPTSTGAIDKVKASAARRGVSDSPALQTQIGRLGVQANQDLSSALTSFNTQKAAYTESARNSWLSALQNLTNQSARGATSTGNTVETVDDGGNDILSGLLSGASTSISDWFKNKQLTDMLGQLKTQSSTTGG
jgi:hypothetical protein